MFADFQPLRYEEDALRIDAVAGTIRRYDSGEVRVVHTEEEAHIVVAGKVIKGESASEVLIAPDENVRVIEEADVDAVIVSDASR